MRDRPPKKGLHFAKVRYEGDGVVDILWALLQEREPHQNISHLEMPTYEEHRRFVESFPYRAWYIIKDSAVPVGSAYLTQHNEVGIFIFKKFQGHGYGSWALQTLIRRWSTALRTSKSKTRYAFMANIAPGNIMSTVFFEKHGFRHIQNTYALDFERITRRMLEPE